VSQSESQLRRIEIKTDIKTIKFRQEFTPDHPYNSYIELRGVSDLDYVVQIRIFKSVEPKITIEERMRLLSPGQRTFSYDLAFEATDDEYKDMVSVVLSSGPSIPLTVWFSFLLPDAHGSLDREPGTISYSATNFGFDWAVCRSAWKFSAD